MAIFVVIPQPNPNTPKLPAAITDQFSTGQSFIGLEDNRGWLISTTGTAQGLSEKLGVTNGNNGAAVIFEIASYFGRANPNIWSWIKEKLEAPPRV
jgi:hypothetical protein